MRIFKVLAFFVATGEPINLTVKLKLDMQLLKHNPSASLFISFFKIGNKECHGKFGIFEEFDYISSKKAIKQVTGMATQNT